MLHCTMTESSPRHRQPVLRSPLFRAGFSVFYLIHTLPYHCSSSDLATGSLLTVLLVLLLARPLAIPSYTNRSFICSYRLIDFNLFHRPIDRLPSAVTSTMRARRRTLGMRFRKRQFMETGYLRLEGRGGQTSAGFAAVWKEEVGRIGAMGIILLTIMERSSGFFFQCLYFFFPPLSRCLVSYLLIRSRSIYGTPVA